MKNFRLGRVLPIAAAIGLTGLLAGSAFAAHPDVTILMRDVTGTDNLTTTGKPYSPKQTCGFCHEYESNWTLASKTHWNRDGSVQTYDVPYPQHGVSAGYHFQQGRNISWDDTKQDFYHVPEFTSSAGMYGKY